MGLSDYQFEKVWLSWLYGHFPNGLRTMNLETTKLHLSSIWVNSLWLFLLFSDHSTMKTSLLNTPGLSQVQAGYICVFS